MKPSPEDYTEIANLLGHYCLALDHDDFDGWRACFTPDGGLHAYGRAYVGEAGLRKVMDTAPKGLHLGGLPAVDILGPDRAQTQQNLWFVDRVSGEARRTVYTDELHRTDDGWRIHARYAQFLVADGLSDRPDR